MTTIFLADDHHIVRQGLHALLAAEPDFRVVGEAADGREAVALIERLQPEVLVLDLMMPGLSGLEVTRQVRRRSPQTRIVILSMYANPGYVHETLKSGAAGYVLKKSTAGELVQAVRQILTGRRYLSPPLSEEEIENFEKKATASHTDPYELLTARQREVLHLLAEGHTNAEVAARLVVSPRTVEFHRAEVMRKLGARTPADLIRLAVQRGILPPGGEL
ncbi:MAG TPA: response regulator transcription factor [Anaerolineae bacterium]|nr:response regulator transcription factor [Anaerolineae bacterium]